MQPRKGAGESIRARHRRAKGRSRNAHLSSAVDPGLVASVLEGLNDFSGHTTPRRHLVTIGRSPSPDGLRVDIRDGVARGDAALRAGTCLSGRVDVLAKRLAQLRGIR